MQINGPTSSGSKKTWWMGFTWARPNASAFVLPVQRGEMLVNGQGDSFPLDWVAANLPGSYLKLGQTGHESNVGRTVLATVQGERCRVAQLSRRRTCTGSSAAGRSGPGPSCRARRARPARARSATRLRARPGGTSTL